MRIIDSSDEVITTLCSIAVKSEKRKEQCKHCATVASYPERDLPIDPICETEEWKEHQAYLSRLANCCEACGQLLPEDGDEEDI